MNAGKAFLAGVTGGAIMTLLLVIARALGLDVNLSMMLGTMLGLEPSTGTWIVGFVMHLIISGLIAILYALGFEYVTHRASVGTGIGFSLVHILVGGVVMAFIPAIHPMIPEVLGAPGAFLSSYGVLGIIAFIALHLVYGGVVGGMYAAEREPVAAGV